MFSKILIANRGEIACRIMRTARAVGVATVAVHSNADSFSRHVREADEAIFVDCGEPRQTYLDADALIRAATESGAEAIHPGYGFLAENAAFAGAVQDAGLVWIGPSPDSIELFGDKVRARQAMGAAGFPTLPGSLQALTGIEETLAIAGEIGYPVMIKAAAGGGGMGMAAAHDEAELRAHYPRLADLAERLFKSGDLLLEKYLPSARHVEVQVFGLDDGHVVALGDRECSVQRRNQKVVEETPSPALDPQARADMLELAARATAQAGYRSAGTVEGIVVDNEFYFLEVNSRIQVEHAITEMVTGVDLIAAQLELAAGEPVSFADQDYSPKGHAIELRVCAEDPDTMIPRPGEISVWKEPAGEGIRVDSGYAQGDFVTTHFDSLMAKLCVWADDRDRAIERASNALESFVIEGPASNIPLLTRVLRTPQFRSGVYHTKLLEEMRQQGQPQ